MKTLFVGLDAACWEYLEPLLQANQMPRLRQLMDAGISGVMHSTMPPWTPTAWATLVTGKNPGKHGVFDMTYRRPGTYDFTPTNAGKRVGTPFWHRLNAAGLRVGLVNVPFTYPPEPLDGFMVNGFGTPDSAENVTYPPELLDWIKERFERFEPAVPAEFLQSAPPEEILEREKTHQAYQAEIAVRMAERYQTDVLTINLMLTDHANHKMPEMEQVQESYRLADIDLGHLIDTFQPDNVMLISDHGSSRLKGDFLLNAWLRDEGYFVQAQNDPAERKAALNWLLLQWLQNEKGWSGTAEKLVRGLIRSTLFKLPESLQARFWQRIEAVFPFPKEYVLGRNQPDYQKTKIFPGSAYAGLLYINLEGRESDGAVAPYERQALTAEIAQKLRQIKEPDTGEFLFSNVYTSADLYTGPEAKNAPDLILDSYASGWNIRTSQYGAFTGPARDRYFVEATNGRDFGWHSRDGIFVFAGPAFQNSPSSNNEAELVDATTTLLHLYDVPVPEDYDGRALTELMTADFCERPTREQPGDVVGLDNNLGEGYSDDEAAEVLNHLKALGYVD